jgi:hypothetical protein
MENDAYITVVKLLKGPGKLIQVNTFVDLVSRNVKNDSVKYTLYYTIMN